MSRTELLVLKAWLEENMGKVFIHQSSSPFAALVLCAKKPERGRQFCIDYQDINSKTINNRYPLPLIKETFNLLDKAPIYSRLDVWGAYNLLWVKEGDEHKLEFQTTYGLFEPTVMEFEMTNTPVDFEGYIKNAIREALDDFASAYLDDVQIYSDYEEEYVGHIKWIMQLLLERGLYLEPEKCEIYQKTVRYLGWLYQSRASLWMKIRMRKYVIGVGKRRPRIDA